MNSIDQMTDKIAINTFETGILIMLDHSKIKSSVLSYNQRTENIYQLFAVSTAIHIVQIVEVKISNSFFFCFLDLVQSL